MKLIYAIATLSGTIIGVGLFALPYITLKVGFWVMLCYFLVLGALVILIHSFFGELALKTPDFKRLPGFAKFHLGNWGERIALISTILGIFGAILAYLIVGGGVLNRITFANSWRKFFNLHPFLFYCWSCFNFLWDKSHCQSGILGTGSIFSCSIFNIPERKISH